ncbi:protein translocase subunit SecF [Brevibacterium sp. UCMA 11754]|uniref:protein translocase subunit SecF n=1 Tax=Brevibacterium sp. UCMA 11754 TaxID=2749198 RepID=UPI001F309AE7|nr:protein translocase subunit SecF [Brevibacterium sp. UCMA 11754]MCF2571526.1 protein translocase subunit SecF [Brevibacterium sp. UCMA 11754]
MKRFFAWGNRLHNGESSIPFVGKAKLWLLITGGLVLLSLLVPLIAGFNFGIAFKGGSQFQVDHVSDTAPAKGEDIVAGVVDNSEPRLTPTSDTAVKIETNQLSDDQMQEVRDGLVSGYDVKAEDVTSTFVGPEWGQDVTEKMIRALVIFVGIAMIVMALYFRTWKMSLAAIVGLLVVMIITTGIYSATGFEITPEAVIGFLTVLSFSLYDTVVVFDKIRENTTRFKDKRNLKFSELVNLGVNQTTVRSINTSVVSVLPIASILFIGVFLLGAGTLVDISLSLFIGTIVAAASTLFVASPLYALLRANEPAVKEQEEAVRELRLKNGAEDVPPVIHAEV